MLNNSKTDLLEPNRKSGSKIVRRGHLEIARFLHQRAEHSATGRVARVQLVGREVDQVLPRAEPVERVVRVLGEQGQRARIELGVRVEAAEHDRLAAHEVSLARSKRLKSAQRSSVAMVSLPRLLSRLQSGRLSSSHGQLVDDRLQRPTLLVACFGGRLQSGAMHAHDAQGVATSASSRLARSHVAAPGRSADCRNERGFSDSAQSRLARTDRVCLACSRGQHQSVIGFTGNQRYVE